MSERLSKPQREQLLLLGDRRAISRSEYLDVYEGISPGSLGALISRGLADKRILSRSGSQKTVYWLTDAGYLVYGELRKAAQRSAAP